MIVLEHISHSYEKEQVLHDISLDIEQGSFNVITGESGSGKSTLLSIVSTLLKPTEGSLSFGALNVKDIKNMNHFRNEQIGFIFQFHYLISHLTVFDNICLVTKKPTSEIDALLERLDILDLKKKYPDEISGGQRQRAAIARALINDPLYLFADEPTGNLDSKNSQNVFALLRELGKTVIVATHDFSHIKEGDRMITLKDGNILC